MTAIFSFIFILWMCSFVTPTFGNKHDGTDQCPNHNRIFKYCNEQRQGCWNSYESACICDPTWCECMTRRVKDYESCYKYVNDECLQTKNKSEMFHRDYQNSSLLSDINRLVEYCFDKQEFEKIHEIYLQKTTGFHREEIAKMGAIQQTPFHVSHRNDNCISSFEILSIRLTQTDEQSHSPIHYVDWHCNWELGDIGMVSARKAAMCLAPNEVAEFNHCCAVRRNCYFYQMRKDKCDEEFKKCNQKVIDSMTSPKDDSFRQMIEMHIVASGEAAYEIAKSNDYKLEDEFDEGYRFLGYAQLPPDRNCTFVVLKRFSSDEKYNGKLSDFYNMCDDWKIYASSCVSLYESCPKEHEEELEMCRRKLVDCFSSMSTDLRGGCKEARDKVVEVINEDIPFWLANILWECLENIIITSILFLILNVVRPLLYFFFGGEENSETTAQKSKWWARLGQCFVQHSHIVGWISKFIGWLGCCRVREHLPVETSPADEETV